MSDVQRPASVEKVMKWLSFGLGVKAFMIEADEIEHEEYCPFCDGGLIKARLAGSRKHLILACDTAGCIRMRE